MISLAAEEPDTWGWALDTGILSTGYWILGYSQDPTRDIPLRFLSARRGEKWSVEPYGEKTRHAAFTAAT